VNRRHKAQLIFAIVMSLAAMVVGTGSIAAADGDPYLVKDIRAAAAASDPRELAAVGNLLYFSADDGAHGRELWRSNGTASGTWMVRDIVPGSTGSIPTGITPLGTAFVFTASDAAAGRELWISNGTRDGTARLVDIRPGSKSSKPADFTVVGAHVYFTADDGPHGRELWRTDGTVAGTTLVKDLTAGPNRTGPRELTALGTRLFLVARTGLWKADEAAAGIRPVLDSKGHSVRRPHGLVASDTYVYFAARNSSGDDSLWRTTGTNSSTRPLLDHVVPQNLTAAQDTLFFSTPGAPGELSHLWATNGTRAGTVLVEDVWTVTEMTAVGARVFFAATNPDGWEEMYVSDGTPYGTRWNYSHNTFGDPGLKNMVDFNGVAYFTFHNYLAYIDCSDGCAGGFSWQPVVPYEYDGADTSYSVRNLTVVGSTLFYSGWDAHSPVDHGQELWAYVP